MSGALFAITTCIVLLLVIASLRRLSLFSGTKQQRVKACVTRKWMIPEHREWQGKAFVTVPAKNALEIVVENHSLHFSPVPWKYDRVREGDDVDVVIQRGRFGNEIRILDIGPF